MGKTHNTKLHGFNNFKIIINLNNFYKFKMFFLSHHFHFYFFLCVENVTIYYLCCEIPDWQRETVLEIIHFFVY